MGTRATSATFLLPDRGEVVLGRSEEATIRLDDARLSRKHAMIRVGDGFEVIDLASRNGTRVGGEILRPNVPRPLAVGDTIEIGSLTVAIQFAATGARPRRLWSHGYFEARLEDECARAERGGGPFAILRVRVATVARARLVEESLTEFLRTTDVMAAYAEADYEVLLIETRPDAARAIAEDVRAHLAKESVIADVAVACYPHDGRTAESLVARSSAILEPRDAASTSRLVVQAGAMQRLAPLIDKVAAGTISVLVLGETGVGKEVMARTIHERSPRAKKPLLAINCASFTESLLESELFGYERGAFTGALQAKQGLLESAEGGTVFLDEIGEMPLALQSKILRVLDQHEVMRVGALKPRAIDVRFIAATNRNLEEEIERGRFRQDLYFRLNGVSIMIPALRERVDEIELLARAFLVKATEKVGKRRAPDIAPDALALLKRYAWPGNIRELRNVMERAALLCSGAMVTLEHLPQEKMGPMVAAAAPARGVSAAVPVRALADLADGDADADADWDAPTHVGVPVGRESKEDEKRRVIAALEQCAGNQTQAAKVLGVSRQTLVGKLEQFNLPRPRKKV